jgi:uncharacterized protein (DUF2252 family)
MAKRPARKPNPAPQRGGGYVSSDERRAMGRALRDQVPRASQAGWKPHAGRRDPVELLLETNAGRMEALIPIRMGRMASSPFAFYRGAAALMAADLAVTPTSGQRVQACGDAHLMNFGGFATPERNVIFDINDFDETLPAPFEWDVKRLAASIVVASQHLRFDESDAAKLATEAVRAYREQLADYAAMRAIDLWYERIDLTDLEFDGENEPTEAEKEMAKRARSRVAEARARTVPDHLFPKLVELHGAMPRIKDEPPLIFHPSVEVAPGLQSGYAEAIATYRESLAEHIRVLFDRYAFFDMALKVVGVGSVGRVCSVGLFMAAEDDPLILQVKEAGPSVLEPYAGKSLHANHGQRVVAGQRLMQSASDLFLGWTTGKNGRDFYVRQLRDMKITAVMDDWDPTIMRLYVRLCARALARSHARSGDAATISGYLGSGQTFDEAMCEFAVEYADQNRRDYRAFVKGVREGRIKVLMED